MMDWIFENPQILLLIVLGLGSMIKSALENRAKKAAEEDYREEREARVPIDEDTSYRKKAPTGPPPLSPPEQPPPLPSDARPSAKKRRDAKPMAAPSASFSAAEEAAKILKHQQDLAERLRLIRETKGASTTGGAAATRARVAAKGATIKSLQPSAPLSLRGRLKDPAEVRSAFVLKEILDRPIGLR
jgi:hypothetical protein